MYIWKEIFYDKEYYTDRNLDGKIIFDIGGNIGLFSLYLNDNYKNINVHCFEPVPQLCDVLLKNIESNKKNNNKFIVNNFGLSDKENYLDIIYFPNASGLSTVYNDINVKKDIVNNTYSK